MMLVKCHQKSFSGRLADHVSGNVCQVVVFVIRLMVSPHDKDNLEPLGSQSSQRLVLAVTFSPLIEYFFAHSDRFRELKENQYMAWRRCLLQANRN